MLPDTDGAALLDGVAPLDGEALLVGKCLLGCNPVKKYHPGKT